MRWFWFLATAALAADPRIVSLRIEPGHRTLQSAGAHQQLLALGTFEDSSERDVTDRARWTVSNAAIAEVEPSGRLQAARDGLVTVTAAVEGRRAQARFEIRGAGGARPFEFGRDIGGILTRKGCNSATCHGGVKGRGGFKLSPGALYPEVDYEWIVKGGAYQVLTRKWLGLECRGSTPKIRRKACCC